MATLDPVVLPSDTWVKVLTNVTVLGSVHILDQEIEPTAYKVAFVNTSDPAPAIDFTGGIKFEESFSPDNTAASDFYVMAVDNDGLVSIL